MEDVLLLNATYEPICTIHWQRAICLDFLDKIDVLEYSEKKIRTTMGKIQTPSVVRLREKVRWRLKIARFTKGNVFKRDKHTCQYCGAALPSTKLTFDHIIPKSVGGRTNWQNIVTCCKSCNQMKSDFMPEEVKMWPKQKPFVPLWYQLDVERYPKEWKKYLWGGE